MTMYQYADIAITNNEDESKALTDGLLFIEAYKQFNPDDSVLIVPNWVSGEKPNPAQGVIVGPDTLKTLIRWVKSLGVKKVVAGCGSGGGDTLEIMKKVGYDRIFKEENIEFFDFNSGPYDELTIDSKIIKKLKINHIVNECTKLISFTQLKIHEEAVISAAVKNVMMSLPSTEEHGTPKKKTGIHEELHDFIAKMAEKIKIDLAVVSANPVMVGTGPIKGAPFHTGLVVCADNPVACDIICARLLGFRVQAVGYLYQLIQKGISESEVNQFNLKGIPLQEAEKMTSQSIYRTEIYLD